MSARAKQHLVAFVAGVVFALGLGVAGMTHPQKVLAFLDVAGAWDPSLAFVMVGAIAVHALAFRATFRLRAPLLGGSFEQPQGATIDRALLGGAALFGIGWGLGGYCPGPGVVGVASGAAPALVFTGAMLVGMLGYATFRRLTT